MKRILMATVLAASTLGLTGMAMAADGPHQGRTGEAVVGSSDGSFVARQSQQYNADNGE